MPISSVTRHSPVNVTVVVPWGSSHHMPARPSDTSALWVPIEEFGLPKWGLEWFLIEWRGQFGLRVVLFTHSVKALEPLASGFGFPVILSSHQTLFSVSIPSPPFYNAYMMLWTEINYLYNQTVGGIFCWFIFFLSGFLVHFPSLCGAREWSIRWYLGSGGFQ